MPQPWTVSLVPLPPLQELCYRSFLRRSAAAVSLQPVPSSSARSWWTGECASAVDSVSSSASKSGMRMVRLLSFNLSPPPPQGAGGQGNASAVDLVSTAIEPASYCIQPVPASERSWWTGGCAAAADLVKSTESKRETPASVEEDFNLQPTCYLLLRSTCSLVKELAGTTGECIPVEGHKETAHGPIYILNRPAVAFNLSLPP
jgi:hypothetical protein